MFPTREPIIRYIITYNKIHNRCAMVTHLMEMVTHLMRNGYTLDGNGYTPIGSITTE